MPAAVPSKCYLCSTTDDLTDDHIPPVGFFPEPRPDNLITVRCCRHCNQGQSLDDEAFRVFSSSLLNRSDAGEWIWRNKVMGSTFRRSPQLRENVERYLLKVPVRTTAGTVRMTALGFPKKRANRFLIRITKGLVATFYPDKDYSGTAFSVDNLMLNQENIDYLNTLSTYDERGERVFRFWRAMASNKEAIGLFAYVFYDACLFMVAMDLDKLHSEDPG